MMAQRVPWPLGLVLWAVGAVALALWRPLVTPEVIVASALAVICMATLRPVRDPYRAVIFRMARLHRLAGPGLVFVMPFVERIEGALDTGERETGVTVMNVRTGDGQSLNLRLEVTWRLDPCATGRLSQRMRTTMLLPEERRAKLVDELATSAARHVVADYTLADLTSPSARASVCSAIAYTANDTLIPSGMLVDRVFWRA